MRNRRLLAKPTVVRSGLNNLLKSKKKNHLQEVKANKSK
jgi:hypothetical protein